MKIMAKWKDHKGEPQCCVFDSPVGTEEELRLHAEQQVYEWTLQLGGYVKGSLSFAKVEE